MPVRHNMGPKPLKLHLTGVTYPGQPTRSLCGKRATHMVSTNLRYDFKDLDPYYQRQFCLTCLQVEGSEEAWQLMHRMRSANDRESW